MPRSYSAYLRSRPISNVSRKPAVVITPVAAPLRSISALVNSVVACTTRAIDPGATACVRSKVAMPDITPRRGSSCVVSTFSAWR